MPNTLADQREHARHYIPASDTDIRDMLGVIGKECSTIFLTTSRKMRFAEAVDRRARLRRT